MNKKFIIIRILTLPFQLAFQFAWAFYGALFMSLKWLLYGGQQMYYGKDNFGGNITDLIDKNEAMIKAFEQFKSKS